MAWEAAQKPWTRTGDEKRSYVRRMFADISPVYDFLNSVMSLRLHYKWRADAVKMLGLKPGDVVADACCGTGDFGRPLRRVLGESGRIIGVDFCRPMLARARAKPHSMSLALGDVCSMPLRDELVDSVSVGWGIRNVPDIPLALSEAYRILKPGGRFVCVDMAAPRSAFLRSIGGFFFRWLVPALGGLFGKSEAYTYLPKSTDRHATREGLAEMMRQAGFSNVTYHDRFLGNICIHRGEK